MKNIIHIILLFLFVGCSHTSSHMEDTEYEGKDNKNATALFILTTDSDIPIEDIRIYGFVNTGELKTYAYYSTAEEVTNSMMAVDASRYTFVAVVNGGADFAPHSSLADNGMPQIVLNDLLVWLADNRSDYPNMLTGITITAIKIDVINRVNIEVKDGSEVGQLSILRLKHTFPDGNLPPLTRSKNIDGYAVENYKLSTVIEIYKKGSTTKYISESAILANHTIDISVPKGEYDVLVWADYVPIDAESPRRDNFYATTDLSAVIFNPDRSYSANTDGKDASSSRLSVTIDGNGITEAPVVLERPFAKFIVVTNDIERYNNLVATENYPPLDELSIVLKYEGYIANTFDVRQNIPTNSITGVSFTTTSPQGITATSASISSDYLFVKDDTASVLATVTISDKNNKQIAQISNIEIKVQRNKLTTVSGDFLTSSSDGSSGGIEIDTSWGDDVDFKF